MRNWGIAVTVFYAVVVALLLVPLVWLLAAPSDFFNEFGSLGRIYVDDPGWPIWVCIGVPVAGEALLLFLSVDTSRKRLKPRAHTLVSASLVAVFMAILTFAASMCVGAGIWGDERSGYSFVDWRGSDWLWPSTVWACLWLFWGFVFYGYSRNSSSAVTQAVAWLLKGSVLELLVAVPCHIIVRHRKDCSAPVVTSFGISTGIAVMLLSFGPSVLFLYKQRLDARRIRKASV